MSPKAAPTRSSQQIGWREMVGLPRIGIDRIKAKIDTGARTSALHAEKMRIDADDPQIIHFEVPLKAEKRRIQCSARLVGVRAIKNTSGKPENRYIIATRLVMGERRWLIEVSLADRSNMGFDLILGRTAIVRRGITVDPGHSFLAGEPVGPQPVHPTMPK